VHLSAVLFAVADTTVGAQPEMRLVKAAEDALVLVPPFKLMGQIHVLQGTEMFTALSELTSRFVPLTEATYWSDTARVARTGAPMVAFNHSRAHILTELQETEGGVPPVRGTAPSPPGSIRDGAPLRSDLPSA
jgi:hypothetical protein